MLHDPTRHEALLPLAWDAAQAQQAIQRIVADAEDRYSPGAWWPPHPRDLPPGAPAAQPPFTPLYEGACGVCWALHHLQAPGAVRLTRSYLDDLDALLERNRAGLGARYLGKRASYMDGDTPIRLLDYGHRRTPAGADALAALIDGNLDHPALELMSGSPGTMLAALFLHELTGEARWAERFRTTAAKLWSQLRWSEEHACHYWLQDFDNVPTTYLDAVHGFVGTAAPLIRGGHLLDAAAWGDWQRCIVNTTLRTATWEDGRANWRAWLDPIKGKNPLLMQFCHGAPGFVICLAGLPDPALDAVLLAAGEAVWAAGPLNKGSNLCHGTGGNGYAFLKLHQRTGNALWLDRARAFAMHGIVQTDAEAARHGRMHYSLWTGDLGFAIYLWGCLHAQAAFPTLDVFYGGAH